MITYLCYVGLQVEVRTDEPLTDERIEDLARQKFFATIETYKQDEVSVEIVEEMHDE